MAEVDSTLTNIFTDGFMTDLASYILPLADSHEFIGKMLEFSS